MSMEVEDAKSPPSSGTAEERDTNPQAVEQDEPENEPPASTIPAVDVARAHLKGLIEALVFVADHPVSVNDLAKAAGGADKKLLRVLVDELRGEYSRRGIQLEEVAG